jgi:hypothetical protein
MAPEIWGTVAVNDHLRPQAFLRELLLFDRLVVPVPSTPEERARWQHPNEDNPGESWQPERLEALLALLGTQDQEGHQGARLAWTTGWDRNRWQAERTRHEVADTLGRVDTFYTTRLVLAHDDTLPGVIEAVAAYPSEATWRGEQRPSRPAPADPTVASALITLGRPLLVPDVRAGRELEALRETIELAMDPEFRQARTKYHEWVRDLVVRLREGDGRSLADVGLDAGSLQLARERLEEALDAERKAVKRFERRRHWGWTQTGLLVVAVGAQAALALVNPLAALGVLVPLGQAGVWYAEKRAEPPTKRSLTGASMFAIAERHRRWAGSSPD